MRSAGELFVLAERSIGTLKLLSRRGERIKERVVHGALTRGWFEPSVLQYEIDLLRRGYHTRAGEALAIPMYTMEGGTRIVIIY